MGRRQMAEIFVVKCVVCVMPMQPAKPMFNLTTHESD